MSDAEVRDIRLHLERIMAHLQNELGGDGMQGNVMRQLGDIRRDLHDLERHIVGTPDTPGIITRLDRLEIAELARARYVSAGLAAVICLVAKAAWELIVHR